MVTLALSACVRFAFFYVLFLIMIRIVRPFVGYIHKYIRSVAFSLCLYVWVYLLFLFSFFVCFR